MTQQFKTWIEEVAKAAGRNSGDVLTLWHQYCNDCQAFDQSPVTFEFCRWYGLPEIELVY